RRRVGVAGDVVVEAGVHTLVVAAVGAVGVVVGVEVFLAHQEGVAGAVGDLHQGDPEALVDDARDIGDAGAAVGPAVAGGQVGQDLVEPAAHLALAAAAVGVADPVPAPAARGQRSGGVVRHAAGQADLFEVVGALDACGRLADLLHGGQQEADEDGDDGDYDE